MPAPTADDRQHRLQTFVDWSAAHITGDEKGLLAQLLELNPAVAAKEKAGEAVTPPGVPATYTDAGKLVTADCIRP